MTFAGLNTPNCTAGKGFRKEGDASASEKGTMPFHFGLHRTIDG
jgi:hypothetical protein